MICVFFILNNLGLSNYNPGVREYLGQFFDLKDKKNYVFFSLAPFLICFILGFLYPSILGLFKIIGLTLCNFNSYILPSWMYIRTIKDNAKMKNKMYLTYVYLGFILVISSVGLAQVFIGFK